MAKKILLKATNSSSKHGEQARPHWLGGFHTPTIVVSFSNPFIMLYLQSFWKKKLVLLLFYACFVVPQVNADPVDNLMLLAHNPVKSVEFSPDEELMVTRDSVFIRMWSSSSGNMLWQFSKSNMRTKGSKFSPDGKRLYVWANAVEDKASFWALDAENGTVLKHMNVNFHITFISFIKAKIMVGGKLAFDFNNATRYRQIMVDQLTFKLMPLNSVPAPYIGISPSGRYLIAIGDGAPSIGDFKAGKTIRLEKGFLVTWEDAEQVKPVFSTDESMLAGINLDGKAMIVSTKTGKLILELAGQYKKASFSFFPDGKSILISGVDRKARRWDIQSGKLLHTYAAHSATVNEASVSSSGAFLLTGSDDGTARTWSIYDKRNLLTSGLMHGEHKLSIAEVRMMPVTGHQDSINETAISPDGKLLITTSNDHSAIVWDIHSERPVQRFNGHDDDVVSSVFSPSGEYVLTGSNDGTARMWNIRTGQQVWVFKGEPWTSVSSVAFSSDGTQALIVNDDAEWIWDVAQGIEISMSKTHIRKVTFASPTKKPMSQYAVKRIIERKTGGFGVRKLSISRDGNDLLICGGSTCRLWSLISGKERIRYTDVDVKNHGYSTLAGIGWMPADNPTHVFTYQSVSMDKTLLNIWGRDSGQRIETISIPSSNLSPLVAVSADGSKLAITTDDNRKIIEIWDVVKSRKTKTLVKSKYPISCMVFSADAKHLLTGSAIPLGVQAQSYMVAAHLWNVSSGRLEKKLGSHFSGVSEVAFSPDGAQIITVQPDGWISVFDRKSGEQLQGFKAFQASVASSIAMSPDGTNLLVGSELSGAALIDLKKQSMLYHFNEQVPSVSSVAFTPDGKYAITGGKDNTTVFWDIKTGKWVAKLLSTGVFEDGYWAVIAPDGRYDSNQPGNVPDFFYIVRDDPLTPLPVEIFMKEYYEPRLLGRILAGEKFPPVKSIASLNRVQPEINILAVKHEKNPFQVSVTVEVRGNHKTYKKNGRNVLRTTGVHDLKLFRDGKLVAYSPRQGGAITLDISGKAKIVFKNIKLATDQKGKTQFSAYAFNDESIKSKTVKYNYEYNPLPGQQKPRAYLISIGVNTYQNRSWNLKYAANDAEVMQRVMSKKLRQNGLYQDVDIISIPLVSKKGDEQAASKARIKAVFDLLAGKKVPQALIASIPNADKIRLANPDDFLLISYSGHGYADQKREFYLFPYDTGMGVSRSVAPSVLKHLISSEELSLWLRDVDAGEMTMIIDACNSAASVEGSGFKPGPMGSSGLGQLAYDKGMRILTASQAESVALESAKIRHGVLTYSLVEEGIVQRQADYLPKDNKIMLGEWLKYAVKRVPKLNQEIALGLIENAGRGLDIEGNTNSYLTSAQYPSLFDFNKQARGTELTIVKDLRLDD